MHARGRVLSLGRWLLEPLQLLVLAQVLFLVIGIRYLNFNITPLEAIITVASAAIAELLFAYVTAKLKNAPFSPFLPVSALAAGLGISIFFRAIHPAFFIVASVAAIASKY